MAIKIQYYKNLVIKKNNLNKYKILFLYLLFNLKYAKIEYNE